MPHSGLKPKNEKDPKGEDDFQWKMTFDGRRYLTEIEFHMIKEMYAALCMCMCAEKTIFLGKDD